jgi:hypothetical protein
MSVTVGHEQVLQPGDHRVAGMGVTILMVMLPMFMIVFVMVIFMLMFVMVVFMRMGMVVLTVLMIVLVFFRMFHMPLRFGKIGAIKRDFLFDKPIQ